MKKIITFNVRGLLRFARKQCKKLVRKARILKQVLVSDNDLEKILLKLEYYTTFMQSSGQSVGILSDSLEAKRIIELGLRWKYIPADILVVCKETDSPCNAHNTIDYHQDFTNKVDSIIVPRLFCNDSELLYSLYSDLRSRSDKMIAIIDSTPVSGTTWKEKVSRTYRYREINFTLTEETVIPSYYANSLYIDYLLALIKKRNVHRMMDICAGQGCIGLSCFKESGSLDLVLNVEINPQQIKAIDETIRTNNFNPEEVKTCLSNGLTSVPEKYIFDLITANPPHQNRASGELVSVQGADMGWAFHKQFFQHADRFLAEDGIICFIENGRPENSSVEIFSDMVGESNPKLELYDSLQLKGTEWYLILIKKKIIK